MTTMLDIRTNTADTISNLACDIVIDIDNVDPSWNGHLNESVNYLFKLEESVRFEGMPPQDGIVGVNQLIRLCNDFGVPCPLSQECWDAYAHKFKALLADIELVELLVDIAAVSESAAVTVN